MNTHNTSQGAKPKRHRRPLREVYASHAKDRTTEKGKALAEFAKAYPCHLETARKAARGQLQSPALRAALNDWMAARGLPPCADLR